MFSFPGQAAGAEHLWLCRSPAIPPALLQAQLPQILPVLGLWGHSAPHQLNPNILGSLTIPCCEVTMCGLSSLSISPVPAPGEHSVSV